MAPATLSSWASSGKRLNALRALTALQYSLYVVTYAAARKLMHIRSVRSGNLFGSEYIVFDQGGNEKTMGKKKKKAKQDSEVRYERLSCADAVV